MRPSRHALADRINRALSSLQVCAGSLPVDPARSDQLTGCDKLPFLEGYRREPLHPHSLTTLASQIRCLCSKPALLPLKTLIFLGPAKPASKHLFSPSLTCCHNAFMPLASSRLSQARLHLHEVLHSDTPRAYLYGRVMSLLILISLIPLCFKEPPTPLSWVGVGASILFLIDYALRWLVADLRLRRGWISFLIYPFTPMAIIDAASLLPLLAAAQPAWRTLRLFRLARAIRAFKIVRYSRSFTLVIEVLEEQKESLSAVAALACGYVLICAIVAFNVEPATFATFFDAVYWAVVSLTTVGYGDLYPMTNMGRLIAMISAFMGIAIIALPSGIITAGFMDKINDRDKQ